MRSVLGAKAMKALNLLQSSLGLDYGGIDFGLDADGNILFFEANATMVVQHPDEDKIWDYRRSAVSRIHAAVHQMFMRRAGLVSDAHRERKDMPVEVA